MDGDDQSKGCMTGAVSLLLDGSLAASFTPSGRPFFTQARPHPCRFAGTAYEFKTVQHATDHLQCGRPTKRINSVLPTHYQHSFGMRT